MKNQIKDWSVKLGKEIIYTHTMVTKCYDAINNEIDLVKVQLSKTTNPTKYKELNNRLKALNKVKPIANYK